MSPRLSILAVTNIFPTEKRPTLGIFVQNQINGLRDIGLDVNVFYVNRTDQGMKAYFTMRKSLMQAVSDFKPALVHVMYGGVMANQVTRSNTGVPSVVTFHGSDLLGENLSGFFRKWISRYGVHCSHRAARRALGVIVVSEKLKNALPPQIPDEKVRVIPCGIDLAQFKPLDRAASRRQLGWDDRAFHVLFASNNGDPVKRPWMASAAIDLAQQAGLQAELHHMRGVLNDQVPVWMNASDALILTSMHEGSPTVVKEALACGLPVVSVDVGDVSERISGIDGCHLVPSEAKAVADKLLLVAKSKSRISANGEISELSIQSVARSLERFYNEVLLRPAMLVSRR